MRPVDAEAVAAREAERAARRAASEAFVAGYNRLFHEMAALGLTTASQYEHSTGREYFVLFKDDGTWRPISPIYEGESFDEARKVAAAWLAANA